MRSRRAASVVLAGALAIATAGCGFITPQATVDVRDVADGVNGIVGDIAIENGLAITADGETVALVFHLINDSGEDVVLNVAYDGGLGQETLEIDVEEGSSMTYGGAGEEQILLEGVDVVVGSLLPVYFQYGDEQGEELLVPVLDGRLDEYANLVPSPEPTPTAEPTPGESGTPQPAPTVEP